MVGEVWGQNVISFTPLTPAQQTVAPPAAPGLPANVFASPPEADAQAAAAAQQKKQERSQKIQQLTFDRRPSAILKAWATPREVALADDRKDGQEPQPGSLSANRVVRRARPEGIIFRRPAPRVNLRTPRSPTRSIAS